MTEQQQRFYIYIMEKVDTRKQTKATKLLEEGFTRQANGTFTPDFMNEYTQRILDLIKYEHIEEVKYILQNYQP